VSCTLAAFVLKVGMQLVVYDEYSKNIRKIFKKYSKNIQ